MKHFNSIKKYADFQKVYRTGKSMRTVFDYVCDENGRGADKDWHFRQQKVGNSVVRHHITRLLRESYRLNKPMVKADWTSW